MEDGSEYLIVFSTVPSVEVGTEIARDLVENMIAACVNIVPRIKSVYEWDGEIVEENESLLIIKTKQLFMDTLIERISEIHPYDIPEIIAMPVVEGNREYLNWIDSAIGPIIEPEEEE